MADFMAAFLGHCFLFAFFPESLPRDLAWGVDPRMHFVDLQKRRARFPPRARLFCHTLAVTHCPDVCFTILFRLAISTFLVYLGWTGLPPPAVTDYILLRRTLSLCLGLPFQLCWLGDTCGENETQAGWRKGKVGTSGKWRQLSARPLSSSCFVWGGGGRGRWRKGLTPVARLRSWWTM